jgi:hypothetical protein
MTVIGTLSSFREPGEMSPHKRACGHLTPDSGVVGNPSLIRFWKSRRDPPTVVHCEHPMSSTGLRRLPQLDGISLRVVQASKAPDSRIGLRVNLNLNPCRS